MTAIAQSTAVILDLDAHSRSKDRALRHLDKLLDVETPGQRWLWNKELRYKVAEGLWPNCLRQDLRCSCRRQRWEWIDRKVQESPLQGLERCMLLARALGGGGLSCNLQQQVMEFISPHLASSLPAAIAICRDTTHDSVGSRMALARALDGLPASVVSDDIAIRSRLLAILQENQIAWMKCRDKLKGIIARFEGRDNPKASSGPKLYWRLGRSHPDIQAWMFLIPQIHGKDGRLHRNIQAEINLIPEVAQIREIHEIASNQVVRFHTLVSL